MKQQFVSEVLKKFADEVIKQSKANLTRGDKNVNRRLYESLTYDLNVSQNSFSLSLFMEKYGDFQDKGVKGADPSQVSKNAKIKGQQAPNSPYSFKSKRPPSEPIAEWAKKRGLRLRDEKGRFAKGDYKTIGYIVAKNIWARGIKPSLFFTKPFENRFRQLPDEVIEAYGLEIDNFMQFTRK